MALHKTLWKPDTCGCVITYEFDDSLPVEQRVAGRKVKKVDKYCAFHQGLTGTDFITAVRDLNFRKNTVCGIVISNVAGLDLDKVEWHYDQNQVLQVAIPEITALKKQQLQTLADNRFGVGKVNIN